MAVKDRALAELLQRALADELAVEVQGVRIRFGRLTVNDFVKLDEKLGVNIFGELMEAARTGGGLPKLWSYKFQRELLGQSLRKFEPEITDEEVGLVLSLIPADKLGEILTWVLAGVRPGEERDRPLPTQS
jgi:hypothetical protein